MRVAGFVGIAALHAGIAALHAGMAPLYLQTAVLFALRNLRLLHFTQAGPSSCFRD